MSAHGFLIYAIVFLTASVLIVPLSKKFGFGSILGYLMAGVLIGPSVLSLVHGSEDMAHYAELGVVFLLFIIGLELQPRRLWSLRKELLGLGLGQLAITSLVLYGLLYLFLDLTWQAAVIISFALALSSTAFSLQSLNEKAELKTKHGQATFSVLLMQDLVAIPILAMIPLLAVGQSEQSENKMQQFFYVMLFIGFLIISSRSWIGQLLRWMALTRSREIFTAMTLLLVLAVSYAMSALGVSMGLGAFLAGVLLADSEYRHEIEVDLEPFKALLMGFFFISVGITVPLNLLVSDPLQILFWVFALMVIKFLVMLAVGRTFKMTFESAKKASLYLALGGEFAFVISGITQGLKILTSSQAQTINLIVTLSMMMTPLLLFLDSWLSNKIQASRQKPKEYDQIESQEPRVIIAGFGRFGQTFGRILRAQGIPFTAVDHDPDQIELLRKFGTKVYYGDCSRQDILEAAGAHTAQFIILAVDDPEVSVQTAELIKNHFPNLKIFARARNRQHNFELLHLGIENIKRELFDSSVYFAGDLLVELGKTPEQAMRIVERFMVHDEILIQEQFKHKDDEKTLMSVSQKGVDQLEQVLKDDSMQSFVELKFENPKDV